MALSSHPHEIVTLAAALSVTVVKKKGPAPWVVAGALLAEFAVLHIQFAAVSKLVAPGFEVNGATVLGPALKTAASRGDPMELKFPAAQPVHCVAPVTSLNFPGAQLVHAVDPGLEL